MKDVTEAEESPELSDVDYLRDLAERLMSVPCTYGTDQYDCDRLYNLASLLETQEKTAQMDKINPGWRNLKHPNGAPVYSENGMLLDERGNRSVFDDVDE